MTQDSHEPDDAGVETEVIELEVDPEKVIRGAKLEWTPGMSRSLVFKRSYHGGYGKGKLQDISGLYWDGPSPVTLDPRSLLAEEIGDPMTTKRIAREEARKEEDADPDEWEAEAMEVWESDARSTMKDELVVEPKFPEDKRTIYRFEYVEDDS